MDHAVSSRESTAHIDAMPPSRALAAMAASQCAAAASVKDVLHEIEAAAHMVASALEQGRCLHYAAAGSSGLMALADACELPGTFQVLQAQIKVHMAGGVPADGVMPGDTEDSTEDAARAAGAVSDDDVAIVISASGSTPYALSFAGAARQNGARIIAIANKPGSELLTLGDVAILLATPSEVLKGSTRLGAGTAQKIALNMISTQAGVLLGHVHEGLMVNLNPDNMKLRKRACDIVAQIAGVSRADAATALKATGFDTKAATLVARGAELDEAKALLDRNKGHLHACLGEMARA